MSLQSRVRDAVPDALKLHHRVARAWREHERTRPLWQMVDQELLEDARLVSDIFVMLDRMPKGGAVAEIGVATGGLSRQILDRCRPDRLLLIDPWDDNSSDDYSEVSFRRIQERMAEEIASGRVELRRGYSHDVLPTLPDDSLDWVCVDAGHDYDNVRQDLENCFRVVRPGGLIAGHDYVRWASPTERYGVVEAINDFVNRTRSPFVFLTNQLDKHDSYAIRVNK